MIVLTFPLNIELSSHYFSDIVSLHVFVIQSSKRENQVEIGHLKFLLVQIFVYHCRLILFKFCFSVRGYYVS